MKFNSYTKKFNIKNLKKLLNLSTIGTSCNYVNNISESKLESKEVSNKDILKYYKDVSLIYDVNSIIYKAINIKTNEPIIIKTMNTHFYILENEYNILKNLIHPYIIKLLYKQDNNLILEYVNGMDMFDFIISKSIITFDTILLLSKQLSEILMYLKIKNIIHCDLKPENIMITSENIIGEKNNKTITYKIKLIDFGSAIKNNNTIENFNMQNIKCIDNYYIIDNFYTPIYSPPERIKNKIISEHTDIWAFGCILYALITKQHPFNLQHNLTNDEIIQNILYKEVTFNQIIWKIIPYEFQNMIKQMLEKDPNKRISIEEVNTIINNLINK